MGEINNDTLQPKKGGKTTSIPVRESRNTEPHTMLGNKALLSKIDKLRELNVGALVPLPQLVVVGDQSSGKSSVLESLTGFSFPRAAGLCTRYATQISVRRDNHESVSISIIPRPNATDAVKERLRDFHREVSTIKGTNIAKVFEEANAAMGIRPTNDSHSDPLSERVSTFSQDVLKIEISRRDGNNLTVIDVPGIFRAATPGLTTDSDITLVNDMVKEYMKNERTIIMAVIPSNVDIATQEILKLAKEADPTGSRTLGVLTKPDLATEKATQQAVFELLQGRRNDLELGYYVVKNRGADDLSSSLEQRNEAERRFFGTPPWDKIAAEARVGIEALSDQLSELLMTLTKREFPSVKKDISDRRDQKQKLRDAMGMSRKTEAAQRSYLGTMSGKFQEITNFGLNAYYTGDKIFEEKPDMKLITWVLKCNENFAKSLWSVGHTRRFETINEDEHRYPSDCEEKYLDFKSKINQYPDVKAELDGILTEDWQPPKVLKKDIMSHIKQVFWDSKGPELGTFSSSIIPATFKEQSKNWEPLLLQHISFVIFIVHQFARNLMEEVCPDEQVRAELWGNILLERMCDAYKFAKEHALFLLSLEREGRAITSNPDFNKNLQRARNARLGESLTALASKNGQLQTANALFSFEQFLRFSEEKANSTHVCEDIHDILKSYYKVAGDRFVDVICLQVVEHDLLTGPNSPLHIFRQELIHRMEADELERIAGEDDITRSKRERLDKDIESLTKALAVLRG